MAPSSRRPGPLVRALVYTLLAVVCAVALWVPFYNRVEPAVFGIPFFYWFQVTWILVAAVTTAVAYRLRV